jgi:glutathione synthase/RimK-type ligase-like ATP-grasp enzyme
VVKPRFGSWGRDVFRCETQAELSACLRRVGRRSWFRRDGALLQELVPTDGRDLRILVAGGRVTGAVERRAAPGEWRTNVTLGGARRPTEPPEDACIVALDAVSAVGVDLGCVDILRRPDARSRWRSTPRPSSPAPIPATEPTSSSPSSADCS